MNGMKAKKMWMAGLALLGIGSLALATKKVADDRKLMKTQEELTEIVRDHFSDMGKLRPSMFKFTKAVWRAWLVALFLRMAVIIPLSMKMKT